jgi:transposase
MTRRQKDPLRPLDMEEEDTLQHLSRSSSLPASIVIRARLVLAVAAGCSYTEAAHRVGRKSGDAVAHLVARFNHEGLEAVVPRHGGGFAIHYGAAERERILQEARRCPDRTQDGTATWSLKTLQRTLRQVRDGLPQVSTYTILTVLQEAGWSWQENRRWCETGQVIRKRKAGKVIVIDPDTQAKKA